ncbi:MAG: translation initiation factor IF-2 [Hyphomicrobiales bacterium]|nr:translation initiation factor IF-2 [Hyphomicrobiales bacterium]
MSDTNDTEERSGGKTLSMRRSVEQGRVKQNFSHGRSKTVVVETKRRRAISSPGASPRQIEPKVKPKSLTEPAPKPKAAAAPKPEAPAHQLSSSEMEARAKALAGARAREADDAEVRRREEKRMAEEDSRRRQEREDTERHAEEEKARLEAEAAEAAAAAEVEAKDKTAKDTPAKQPAPESRKERSKREDKQEQATPRKGGAERRRGKLTISNALDDNVRQRSLAAMKRRQERQKQKVMGSGEPREKIAREVTIPEVISIQELANRMAERGVDIIKFMMKQGDMHKITDIVDADTAQIIAEEFGHTVKRVSESDVELGLMGEDDDQGDLESRAPVVTVMGHVDHGKTSLLDALRNANVVSGEAGGITQHIGAYQVQTPGGLVSFVDTPGHAAFTAMRARGAKVTDIVILVVAADDGVMPQTIEAINHAKAAEVPIIIAINKMDKPEADPTRVRNELLQHEIVVESLGGEVQEVEVSALKKQNLEGLLEAIVLQSEILELKANPDRSADGVVIEAKLDKGRGPVATVLVQRGTLGLGDIFVAGSAWGRVRALVDDQGNNIDEAGPSKPVEVLGLNSAPEAGDQFVVVENEARAREITDYRERKRREMKGASSTGAMSLEQMMSKLKENELSELPILVKCDVQGSGEAITQALEKLGTDEVAARVVHYAVGGISESDITLATASNALVMGFNVRANNQARDAAEAAGVEIRYYNVIYDLVDDVKAALSGMLSPEQRETFLGNAEILEVFNISKVGKVAGCRVTEGNVERGAKVRLIRDSVVIHEGTLSTLKRFKDEVKEVTGGQECGMAFENYQDMRQGDVIECFRVEEVARTLD